jgi:hypothetical protein
MTHEELPVSLNTDDHGREIPIELRMYLEKIKKQYLTFLEQMQVSPKAWRHFYGISLLLTKLYLCSLSG